MFEEKESNTLTLEDIDILGSIEFDLTEAIKDLIWNIKSMKNDVDNIKEYLHLSK